MANPTSNFGWQMPTSTDLVTDLPADFETFGQAVDTSLAELKGGTTGQVLSKTSNTDMDFTWVTSDDANAIQNTIVDAKGDLIAASASDVPARLAVGNNGETLVADSSTSTGLRYQGNFAAGKNKIINGDFNIWQRGNPAQPTGSDTYTADRWFQNTGNNTDNYITRQAFTPGTAPVAGYEGNYYLRWVTTPAGSGGTFKNLQQRIEDVTTLAGQTATFSFWAKADAARDVVTSFTQNFGSGGSSAVTTTGATHTLTTSWARYSVTVSIPSISGKTIGTSSYLRANFALPLNTAMTIEFWGVQVEAGSVATAFQTATGTIQGELAACQRYYWRTFDGTNGDYLSTTGSSVNATIAQIPIPLPVTMRTYPTVFENANIGYYNVANLTVYTGGTWTLNNGNESLVVVRYTHGSSVLTAGQSGAITSTGSGYIAFGAEL